MLKNALLLSSSVTLAIMILNFAFKVYLAREFTQENLVVYYTIIDAFSIITRVFLGYKDALITLYSQTKDKFKILKTLGVFFIWSMFISTFIVIPIILNYFLIEKIANLKIEWWHLSLLFLSINFVSFYGYIFLATKHYKIISYNDIFKSISLILMTLFLYLILNLNANYKTLLLAFLYSNFIVLIYLVYQQNNLLPGYSFKNLIGLRFPKFNDDTNKIFIKLTIIASSSYFVYGLLLFAPTWTMLNYGVTSELAEFQVVARSIYFALISVFAWPLGRFMFPEFSSLISKNDYKSINVIRNKFIKLLIIFGTIFILGCFLLSKVIIGYLFPSEYINSYKMLNILIVALPFVMYQNFSESIIKAVGNYRINLIIKASGVVCFIISYLFLNAYNIGLPSIYSFVAGVLAIFLISLYYEVQIRRNYENMVLN